MSRQDRQIVQEALAQITWYHNLALMEKRDGLGKPGRTGE